MGVAEVGAQGIGGIRSPREAGRKAREPIAAALLLERRPRHLQRALGAPAERLVWFRHLPTVSTPLMTNCTASAASTTPSMRVSTMLPVVPSRRETRSAIRKVR